MAAATGAGGACIISSSDGEAWHNYFSNYLSRVFPNIAIETLPDHDLLQLSSFRSKVKTALVNSTVVIFIISPGFLEFMVENPTVKVRDLWDDSKNVVFLCGTKLDDFMIEDGNGREIRERCPTYNERCLMSYPEHDVMLEQVVSMLESSNSSSSSQSKSDDKHSQKANGKRKRKSKGFKFVPKEVNCEGMTNVIISFDELIASDEHEINIEVEVDRSEEDGGPSRITADWLNPHSFIFKAPERRAGTLKAQVFSNGKLIGTEELTYDSPLANAVVGIHVIYLRLMKELCSSLDRIHVLTHEVDTRLSEVLCESRGDEAIPDEAFQYFHRVHRLTSSDQHNCEFPTMFHLAAEYGLQELGQRLTEIPDARHSFCTYNVGGNLPDDVARISGHLELARAFEHYKDDDSFQKFYDSYISMNPGCLSSPDYLHPDREKGKADNDNDSDDYEPVPTEVEISRFSFGRQAPPIEARSTAETRNLAAFGEFVEEDEETVDKTNSIDLKSIEEMENPYECRMQKQHAAPNPVKFTTGSSAVSIPRSQQELIHIMEQVKNQQLTMGDAEVLFKAWKIRYQRKTPSVKQKEDQLAKMRQETEKNQKEKKHFLGKKGTSPYAECNPEIMPFKSSKPPVDSRKPAKPAAPLPSADRTSTASSSSRDSTCSIRSRTSTTSGIDIDETNQSEVAPKLQPRQRSADKRKSIRLQTLEKELHSPGALEPPPLPPRDNMGQKSLSSVPLPKIQSKGQDSESGATSEKSTESYATASKKLVHQESMPEQGNPKCIEQPRKFSHPNIPLPSVLPAKHSICPVPEESDEPESSKNPSRATGDVRQELMRMLEKKSGGFGLKPTGLSNTSHLDSTSSSETVNRFPLPGKPTKKPMPVLPKK